MRDFRTVELDSGRAAVNRFPAKYDGVCGVCGERYDVGVFIVKDRATGKYVHNACVRSEVDKSGFKVTQVSDDWRFRNDRYKAMGRRQAPNRKAP